MIRSAVNGVAVDKARAPEITVPVLVVFGDKDPFVWTRDGEEQQANFSGSRDVTTDFVSGRRPLPDARAIGAAVPPDARAQAGAARGGATRRGRRPPRSCPCHPGRGTVRRSSS